MASSTVPFGLLVILAPGQSLRSGLGLKGSLCNVTEPQVEGSWGVGGGDSCLESRVDFLSSLKMTKTSMCG